MVTADLQNIYALLKVKKLISGNLTTRVQDRLIHKRVFSAVTLGFPHDWIKSRETSVWLVVQSLFLSLNK